MMTGLFSASLSKHSSSKTGIKLFFIQYLLENFILRHVSRSFLCQNNNYNLFKDTDLYYHRDQDNYLSNANLFNV